MTFGQPVGPPATRRQVADLLALVQAAGHLDFRDARGPLGLTQRQANGRFTREEADHLIECLEVEAETVADEPEPGSKVAAGAPRPARRPAREPVTAAQRRRATQCDQLRGMPAELLAAELQRRGWAVIEP